MTNKDEKTKILLEAVEQGSSKWKSAFNSGDSKGCADQYEKEAVMEARPFGTFTGHEEIMGFWQKLIDDGFSDIEYFDTKIEPVDEKSAILKSNWKMNKAKGIIHKELWVIQPDGSAKLHIDIFEAIP